MSEQQEMVFLRRIHMDIRELRKSLDILDQRTARIAEALGVVDGGADEEGEKEE